MAIKDMINCYDENFYKCLPAIRYAFNLTQEELAELCGVSRQTVFSWEKGKTLFTKQNYITLMVLLRSQSELKKCNEQAEES